METATWLGSEALGMAGSFVWNFIVSGFLYGMLGFFVGLVFVYLGHRKGWFNRPNKAWNTWTWTHYLLVPVLLGLTGMSIGAMRGIQETMNDWADGSSQAIKDYTEQYIPTIVEIAEELAESTGIANISEGELEAKIEEKGRETLGDGVALGIYTMVCRKIIGYCLVTVGLEDDPNNVPKLAEAENIRKMRDKPLDGASGYVKQGVGGYMSGWYWFFIIALAPFYLYLLIEYLVYRVNNKVVPIAKDKFNNMRNR